MSITQAERIRIASGQGDYEVVFPHDEAEFVAVLGPTDGVFTVIDERVAALYPAIVSALPVERLFSIAANEENKTLAGVERVCTFLRERGANKSSRLVVIGGGILQDIGGFAAHVYHRGIPYTLVPTTLLAMADSSIGAKTGVNLGPFKNQLGFFQSPAGVVSYAGFLRTLPTDDVRSGFGEIVKLALIAGEDAFAALVADVDAHGFATERVGRLVRNALTTKKRIIEEDEYETGIRAILNFGHTFGHAIESITDHEVPHGLAVAWGVDVASFVASRIGMLDVATAQRVHAFLARHFTRPLARRITAADLIAAMKTDKKAAGNRVRLVLPAAVGDIRIVPTALDEALIGHVAAYLETSDLFAVVNA